MAKAVTLKNNNNEEVYPVTDLSLVNGDIPTGRIADNAITTSKIASEAVTSAKIDWATLKTGKPTKITTSASGFTYTATKTGFLYVGTACGNNQYATIKLNGTEIAQTKGPGGYNWSNTPVFVTPGDVVAATTSDNGGNAQITASSFVPIS